VTHIMPSLPFNSQLTVRSMLRMSPEPWISVLATAVKIFASYYAGRSAHAARRLQPASTVTRGRTKRSCSSSATPARASQAM
jgi:hypothetical protein